MSCLARGDADHLARQVDDRAARIAGVDGDPELIKRLAVESGPGTHHAPADGVLEHELGADSGVADDQDVVAFLELIGLGDLEWWKVGFHPEEGQVAFRVLEGQLDMERPFRAVASRRKANLEVADDLTFDDMSVGGKQSSPHQETGAQGSLAPDQGDRRIDPRDDLHRREGLRRGRLLNSHERSAGENNWPDGGRLRGLLTHVHAAGGDQDSEQTKNTTQRGYSDEPVA